MNPFASPATDTTNRIGVELPPCHLRTIIGGKHIHCGHSAMHTELALYPGAKAGIVSAAACRKCKILTWPCETPKPPPIAFLGYWWSVWAWGRALKRFIAVATFGRVKASGCGPCGQRASRLDRLGARAAKRFRSLLAILRP